MKKKLIFVFLFIAFVLIGLGIGMSFLNSNDKDKDKGKDPEKVDKSGANLSVSEPDKDNYTVGKDGELKNNSKKISTKHDYGMFSIDNMKITFNPETDYIAKYSYEITNNDTSDYENVEVTIILIFADDSRLVSNPYNIERIGAGEKVTINMNSLLSAVGAVDFEFSTNK